LNPI
jgi:hypothetical protein